MKKLITSLILLTFLMSACANLPAQTAIPVEPSIAPSPANGDKSTEIEPTQAAVNPEEKKTEQPANASETTAVEATLEPTIEAPAEKPAIVITDALGREVSFLKTPERIALVGKGVFMVADAVYMFPTVRDRVIGIAAQQQKSADFLSILDPNLDQKQEIELSAGPEQIAALQPDCIILKTTNKDLGESLAKLGIPVVFLELETYAQYDRDLETLGTLFQEEDRAIKLRAYYRTNVADISKYFVDEPAEELPTVLLINYSAQDGAVSFNVAPASWIQTAIVETAGGIPVWKDAPLGKGWTKVGLEQIAAWDPDYIFVTSYTAPVLEAVATLKADPQWQELRAVKNSRLRPMLGDIYPYDQPDTRWVLGLLWIARSLHPDVIWSLDFYEAARNFYSNLYEMDTRTYEQNIKPLLRPYFQ
ncbi:MAG TPA: ABC transporter substrate-binding protein [Anaerolineaceae bacterium]|nr:ABC transporter substrate-binding protein [Anaerolineaceae bacterium]